MTGTDTPPVRTARRRHSVWLVVLLIALTSCGGGDQQTQAPPSVSATKEYRPVTVENCGRSITFSEPPQRIVSMTQTSTELLLALGMDDRMVGTAKNEAPPLPQQRESYEAIPVLADEFPSREALIGVSPDLVIAGLDKFAFTENQGRGRDSLESLGINTYALQCSGDEGSRVELFFQKVDELGRILGVEDRAAALTDEMRGSLGGTEQAVAGVPELRVFVYHSGQNQPNTFPGEAAATELIDTAGGINVVRDVPGVFGPVSWEQVAAANPDVIVVADEVTGESAEAKRQFLLSFPGIAQTTAIQQQRIAVVPFVEMVPAIRMDEGAGQFARALHPSQF